MQNTCHIKNILLIIVVAFVLTKMRNLTDLEVLDLIIFNIYQLCITRKWAKTYYVNKLF